VEAEEEPAYRRTHRKVTTLRRQHLLLIAAFALTLLGCTARVGDASDPRERLESHVAYLAGDLLEGRLVGTPGIEKAAEYIKLQFEEMGLTPAFVGSYYQEFMIEFGTEVSSEPGLTIGETALSHPHDFSVLPISGSGSGTWQPVIVNGPPSPEISLSGKVVFVVEDARMEDDRWTLMGHDGLLDWMKETSLQAEAAGARAVIFLTGGPEDPGAPLHTFAITRRYGPLEVPALEMAYARAGEIFSSLDVSLDEVSGALSDAEGVPVLDIECKVDVSTAPRQITVQNVAGLIQGSGDPDKFIVVGAHYDHLGYGDIASSTPWRREIHNGADDNASGVAAVIETARNIVSSGTPNSSVVFVCFTAEELGAVGSEYYCKNCPHAIESTVAMINLDTVGRLEGNSLIVFGARSATEFDSILNTVGRDHPLELIEKQEIYGFSDQNPFYARGIPALHFFSGAHDDYHSPDDDWEKINFEGLAAVTSLVSDFTMDVAFMVQGLTPVVELEEPSRATTSRGRGAFLGIIPDFTYSGTGVGIKGAVRKSPAQMAGLESGDVILRIDGKPIPDLQGLMEFLVARSPGDTIDVECMRGLFLITKTAILSGRATRE
jgi:aminopeptidase YwaD